MLLSLQRPSPTYRESLFGRRATGDIVTTLRVVLTGILPDSGAGRFGLRPQQHLPLNAYLDLQALQRALGQQDQVNSLLSAAPRQSAPRPATRPQPTPETLPTASWTSRCTQTTSSLPAPAWSSTTRPAPPPWRAVPPYSSKPRPSRPIWPTPLWAMAAKFPTQPLPLSTIPPALYLANGQHSTSSRRRRPLPRRLDGPRIGRSPRRLHLPDLLRNRPARGTPDRAGPTSASKELCRCAAWPLTRP